MVIFILLASQVLVLPFFLNTLRLYIGFTPAFVILAFAFFIAVVTRLQSNRIKGLLLAAAVLFCCSYGVRLLLQGPQYNGAAYQIGSEKEHILSSLNSSVSSEDILCSDIVEATGRYVDCRSLPLPKDLEYLQKMQDDYAAVNYILLSDYVLTQRVWKEWWEIYRNQREIAGFVLMKKFGDGSLFYKNTRKAVFYDFGFATVEAVDDFPVYVEYRVKNLPEIFSIRGR